MPRRKPAAKPLAPKRKVSGGAVKPPRKGGGKRTTKNAY